MQFHKEVDVWMDDRCVMVVMALDVTVEIRASKHRSQIIIKVQHNI